MHPDLGVLLVRNATLHAPHPLEMRDLIAINGRIAAIGHHLEPPDLGLPVTVIDAGRLEVVPGFLDSHMHVAGAGSTGAGPISREPDFSPEELFFAGVTTVIGTPGADYLTRSLPNLLAKARALEAEGITAHIWSGGYQKPMASLSGSVAMDLLACEMVAGAKVAISDYMAPAWSGQELHEFVHSVISGAQVSGKRPVIHVHCGVLPPRLAPIREVVDRYRFGAVDWSARHGGDADSIAGSFQITHVNWSDDLLSEAIDFGRQGGRIDFTAGLSPSGGFGGSVAPARAITRALGEGVAIGSITISSDSGGNESSRDEHGRVTHLLRLRPPRILEVFQSIVKDEGLPVETAVRATSTSVADLHGWPQKGRIAVGADADLLFLDQQFSIVHLTTCGTLRIRDGAIVTPSLMYRDGAPRAFFATVDGKES